MFCFLLTFFGCIHYTEKGEVFVKKFQFQKYIKTQFNKDIQPLQCDNRGKYDNTQFHEFLCLYVAVEQALRMHDMNYQQCGLYPSHSPLWLKH